MNNLDWFIKYNTLKIEKIQISVYFSFEHSTFMYMCTFEVMYVLEKVNHFTYRFWNSALFAMF